MKKHVQALTIAFSALVLIGGGCASAPPAAQLPPGALPNVEIASLEHDLQVAAQKQADVLSPRNFEKARDHLNDAKKDFAKEGSDHNDALKEVAQGRAYLNRANEVTARATTALPELLPARWAAVTARGGEFDTEHMIDADNQLKSIGRDFEKGDQNVSADDSRKLQAFYLETELHAIKGQYLGPSRAKIDQARDKKAEKLAPRTLASAEQKIHAAETAITTDRHNTALIQEKSNLAKAEADRLWTIVTTAEQSKSKTPEELALELDSKEQSLASKDAMIAGQTDALAKTKAEGSQQLAQMQQANQALAAQAAFERSFDEAQKQFSSDEAEVYKQNGNLLLRLKGLRFASGGSQLPAENTALLNKVKNVIESMNAERVAVQGHTDSVGGQAKNEKLSQKRADAVAKYLVASNAVTEDKVEAEGYGYSRPLASNKSKDGRAQNRRVDIVVTPAGPDRAATDRQEAQELPPGQTQPPAAR